MGVPTDIWGTYQDLQCTSKAGVTYSFMKFKLLPALKSLGYIVPSQRALESILSYGVDPLPRIESGHAGTYGQSIQCTFEHFLNILWHPLIEHVEGLGKDPDHQRRKGLDLHHKALVTEMEGIVPSPDETMDMDAWVEYIQQTLLRTLEVHVPSRLILQVVAPVVPLSLQPTAASALHLLRSSLCSKLVGPAMAEQANRKILAEISEVPVKMCAEQDMNQNIRRDLIALLEEKHCVEEADAEEDLDCRPLKNMRKGPLQQTGEFEDLDNTGPVDAGEQGGCKKSLCHIVQCKPAPVEPVL